MEQTALAKYKPDQFNVLVKPEDLQTQRLFVPKITVIPATPEDFHERPINGRMMPKRHHVDRLGEAGGVDFIAEHCGTRKEGATIWVGFAQGRRRMPDGSWRASSKQEYEFDVEVRAEEDFLNDKTSKYPKYETEIKRQKHIVDLKKGARARASTGARLRVIRELLGIPIAFGPKDFKRAIVVCRICPNTDVLLESPDTRKAAINQALGVSQEIYGPAEVRDVTSEPEALPAPGAEAEQDDSSAKKKDPFAVEEEEAPELTPEEIARRALEDWLNADIFKDNQDAQDLINETLNDKNATLEALESLIGRCKEYAVKMEAKKKAGVTA